MNPLSLRRVPAIVIAFLMVNVAFIIPRVAQDTVVAAASGYNHLANPSERNPLRWVYHLWNPYYPTFANWFVGLSGVLWIGMSAVAALIVFRELTGRRHFRHEPLLWWSALVWGCILAGGIANYIHGPARWTHYHLPTSYYHPGTPAHFLYPLVLILFACIGLRSFRTRAGSVPAPILTGMTSDSSK